MKKWILTVLFTITIAGCGAEWFPENKPTTVVLTPSIVRICGATAGATTTSQQAITVSGITSAVTISISGNDNSKYSLDGGTTFVNTAGTVSNGQKVFVQHTSAPATAGNNSVVITTLDIGGAKGYFKTDTNAYITCTQE